jgi:molybdate transport system substrate-binding protein
MEHLDADGPRAVRATVHGAEIRVFSGGAAQEVLRAIAPEFEQATGHHLQLTFRLVTEIERKLAAGEKADVILLPVPLIARAERGVPMRADGRMVLARVGIGVIVREGTTPPDISTAAAVRRMLLDAKAVTWSDPATPSGGHLQRVVAELGIADAVRPKLITSAAIGGGAELVAKGNADVGFFLVSEVQKVKGVTLVGLLPPPLQSFIVYGTAIPADNPSPEPALAFVKFISAPAMRARWVAAGFELVGDGSMPDAAR